MYVRSSEEVKDLVDAARDAGRLGIDLEFIREKTYIPELALIQIASRDDHRLIDPLSDISWRPVAEAVADPDVTVVVHAGEQDFQTLWEHADVTPKNVFDTQVAAAFCGFGHQIAYSALVARALGREVVKGESYTDWLRRPLTERQEEYALDDVRHLFDLHDKLSERLQSEGRLPWAEEEFARHEDRGRYDVDPRTVWRKVKRFGTLDPASLSVLIEIAAWREETARQRNRPRRRVLGDEQLIELARSKPKTRDAMSRIRGLPASEVDRSGRELVARIEAGIAADPGDRPVLPKRAKTTPEIDLAADFAQALHKAACRRADLAPPIVANASDVADAVRTFIETGSLGDSALATGWRRDLVGRQLVAFLEGQVALAYDPKSKMPLIEPR